jgi:hypothetical protein
MDTVVNRRDFVRKIAARASAGQDNQLYSFLLFDDRASHTVVEKFAANEYEWLDNLAASVKTTIFVYFRKETIAKLLRPKNNGKEQVLIVGTKDQFRNPSLEVAKLLGVKPSELPGIAFFTTSYPSKTPMDAPLLSNPSYQEAKSKLTVNSVKATQQDNDVLLESLLVTPISEKSDGLTTVNGEIDIERTGIYIPIKAELFEKKASEVEALFLDLFSLIEECRKSSENPQQLIDLLRKEVDRLNRSQAMRPIVMYGKTALLTLIALPLTIIPGAGKAFVETFVQETVKTLTGN